MAMQDVPVRQNRGKGYQDVVKGQWSDSRHSVHSILPTEMKIFAALQLSKSTNSMGEQGPMILDLAVAPRGETCHVILEVSSEAERHHKSPACQPEQDLSVPILT